MNYAYPIYDKFEEQNGCYPSQFFIKKINLVKLIHSLQKDESFKLIHKSGLNGIIRNLSEDDDFTSYGIELDPNKNFKLLSAQWSVFQDSSINAIGQINGSEPESLHSFSYIFSTCNNKIYIVISRSYSEENVAVLFDLSVEEEANKITDFIINNFTKEDPKPKGLPKINLLNCSNGRLYTTSHNIEKKEIDLESNYGQDFMKVHEKIMDFLHDDQKNGLCMLHGSPGCGKTYYIRKLLWELADYGKEVIYLPPMYASSLSNPEFIPFLLEKKNSILIIEDAEAALLSREEYGHRDQSVSNLLNLSDGTLGDIFKIKIICTFNTPESKLDKALLRKGRLSVMHEFKPLSPPDADRLLERLGKNPQGKSLSLAQIYNIDSDNGHKEKEEKKMGFAV
jgi:hypothetical protein